MMMVAGQNLRDVIAFPKTQAGVCALTGAPTPVTDEQLAELDMRGIAQPPTP